ncbi:MAG: OB-fold domain-containing protein [Acidimicrobiia bacterium]
MARIPIEEGFFRIPDDPAEPPRLLGSRCPSCGEVFFPRRLVCAKCLHEGCEDVDLSTRGRLWTWTYCHAPLFGKKDADVPGYGVGQVDLAEGPRVQSILLGGPDDFEIGMELEIDLETLRENEDGDEIVIYRFRPAAEYFNGVA